MISVKVDYVHKKESNNFFMNKFTKILLFGTPILIGGYLIYRQFKLSKNGKIGNYVPPETPEPPVSTTPNNATAAGCSYPLKKGDNCDLVKKLQWALNHIPAPDYNSASNLVKYRPLKEDGVFGDKTQALVSDFGVGIQVDSNDMDIILSYVVTDPNEFARRENPYVTIPPPTMPPETKIKKTTNPFQPKW